MNNRILSEANYIALDIHFSSLCNMACSYCYINKSNPKELKDYNDKIREKIITGEFINNIKKIFSTEELNNFTSIGLWGAEPTINAEYFYKILDDLCENMKNLQFINFSTNALLGYESLSSFFSALKEIQEKYQRKLHLTLQISLDGPNWVTDDSRHPGATKKILNTIYEICESIPEDYPCSIRLQLKPTLAIKYMKKMNENKELIKEYFNFFNNIEKKAKKIKKSKNLSLLLQGSPTLIIPGEYTIEDGKIFAEWIKNLDKNDIFRQSIRGFIDARYSKNNITLPNNVVCGAGKAGLSINCDGELLVCHRLCRFSYEKNRNIPYLNQFTTFNDKNINKMIYTSQQPWHHNKILYQNFEILALAMAAAGQIDKIYFSSKEARKILYQLCTGAFCYIGNIEYTKNEFIFPPDMLRLFGNGAMQQLMKYGVKKGYIKI